MKLKSEYIVFLRLLLLNIIYRNIFKIGCFVYLFLDGTQYMSFGLSPDPEKSVMVGGDIVVAWVDKRTLQGYAVDYFLDAKSQCSGQRGSCPDTRIQV